jgi:hypothetical protein
VVDADVAIAASNLISGAWCAVRFVLSAFTRDDERRGAVERRFMQDAAASLEENHIPLTLNGWQSAAGWPDELLCPSVLSRVRLADPERLKTFLHDVVACLNESDDFLLLVSLATVAAAAAWWDDSVVQLLTLLQKETKSGAEVD